MNKLDDIKFIFKEDGSGVIACKMKESFFKKKYIDIYQNIIDYCYNMEDLQWIEKLHRYVYNINDNKCECCDNKCKFRGFLRGYNKYCSSKCCANDVILKEKRYKTLKKTVNDKYGVDNVFQLETTKDKTKKTIFGIYGVENPRQSEIISNKIKNTNNIRYNTDYGLSNKNIIEKKYQTTFENLGVRTPFESEEVKEKIKKTNLEIWGHEKPFKSTIILEKIAQTNEDRYGVRNIFSYKPFIDKTKNNLIEKYNSNINNEFFSLKDYDNSVFNIFHYECNNFFSIKTQQLYNRILSNNCICTECYPISENKSIKEKELIEYVQSFGVETTKDRNILEGKELDIYIPSHNLAIEFNGLYWHSEYFKEKDYHLDKSLKCQEKSIFLMHIWEDEWKFKRDIVKSIISNRLGKIENKIYARKCEIKEVSDSKLVRKFLDENHIQGYSQSSIKLGLYYENELVSLMTFGYRHTNNKKEFELIRFCNKLNTNVIGASSRLFKHLLNNYDYTEILSYSDFRLFDGKMYESLGFEKIHLSKPDYFWIVDDVRKHRFTFNKKKLIKEGYDASKTEVEIMHERGYYRIFSCGQIRWIYKKLI